LSQANRGNACPRISLPSIATCAAKGIGVTLLKHLEKLPNRER
jgi:hypothetical protein